MTTDTQVAEAANDFDYDAEFAARAGKLDKEKLGIDTTPAPAAAAPVPDPAATAAAAPAGAEAVPAKELVPAKEEEWLTALPEETRAQVQARLAAGETAEKRAQQLERDLRSTAGRVSAYQRRYEEAVGLKQPAAAKAASEEQTAEWKQFAEDYPDIAKAIESRYASSLPEGERVDVRELAAYVENEKRERFLGDAFAAVEAVHPGWRDLGRTPQFMEWRKTSPAYEKLASSDDIADAIALFDLYSVHSSKAPQPTQQEQNAAAQLAARRNAQVEGGRSQSNKANMPDESVDLSDADQLFALYAAKSDQRIKGRYR